MNRKGEGIKDSGKKDMQMTGLFEQVRDDNIQSTRGKLKFPGIIVLVVLDYLYKNTVDCVA